MTEYDDRSCASNMYLPSCTYYVSTPDFTSVSSFLPQTTSCQINFPYSPNIAQVQPVREVAFRDYGLDHPSKWHYRGNYASYYSTDEIMHRDLIQSSGGRADVLFKNESLYGHRGGTSSPCNFFTGVGRNGVLPQGFDQFLDPPNSDKPNAEHPKQKTDSAAAGGAAAAAAGNNNQALTKLEQHKADPTGSVDEDSSSNCGDKNNQQSKYFPLCLGHKVFTLDNRVSRHALCPPQWPSRVMCRFISMQKLLYPNKIYFTVVKVFTMGNSQVTIV